MTTELQTDAGQLRAELTSIRSQMNVLFGRLVELEQRLNINVVSEQSRKAGRPNNGRLKDFIVEVLQNSNEPLTVKEVADLVLDAGYKTTSKNNFVKIVLKTLIRSPAIRRFTRSRTRPTRYVLADEE